MEEITVLCLWIVLRNRQEAWEGEGYVYWPEDEPSQTRLALDAAVEARKDCEHIVSLRQKWKVDVRGETQRMRGPRAQKMRHHLNEVGSGRKPMFAWKPVVLTFYGLSGQGGDLG